MNPTVIFLRIIQHSQQRAEPGHFGEAKGELKKRLVKNKLGGRIVGIETIDRMTDRQIAAKVRQYFQENRDKKGT